MEKIEPIYSSVSNTNNKKYLTPQEYKRKLYKENTSIDENIEVKEVTSPKPISTSRYLSPEEFKKRLKGK